MKQAIPLLIAVFAVAVFAFWLGFSVAKNLKPPETRRLERRIERLEDAGKDKP